MDSPPNIISTGKDYDNERKQHETGEERKTQGRKVHATL